MDSDIFVSRFAEMAKEDHAAVFVGRGIPAAGGRVDWRMLVETLAQGVGFDTDTECDFPQPAQHYLQEYSKNDLIQAVVKQLGAPATHNETRRGTERARRWQL